MKAPLPLLMMLISLSFAGVSWADEDDTDSAAETESSSGQETAQENGHTQQQESNPATQPNTQPNAQPATPASITQNQSADVEEDTAEVEGRGSLYYGPSLCNQSKKFKCIKVKSGENWERLFPNEQQRDLVQRINRTYNYLTAGKELAVPVDLDHATMLAYAPFPQKINTENEKEIIVDQDKLAWGAFNEKGELVKWGPISSGRDRCPDSPNKCLTLTGIYRVFSKESSECVSDIFPIGEGGAKMPYCMFFHKGFALHGSNDIPGYRASHGCVRMFTQDAKWLNEQFVDVGRDDNRFLGTRVVVRPVYQNEES